MEGRRAHRPGRWTITAGALLIAMGVLSFNAWADFTASQTTTNSISTGTMHIVIADGPTAFSVAATDLVPNDYVERFVNIHTTGSLTMQNMKLASDIACGGCSTSLLDSDAVNGLQLLVSVCDQAWTLHANATATCGGTPATVMTSRAVIQGTPVTLSNVHTDGTVDYLRFQWHLPSSADDTFQGLTSVIEYTFTGTQPANITH